jgi:RNA methyltransferase, TrmH family
MNGPGRGADDRAADLFLSSAQNPRVKQLLALWERRDRDRQGLMLVEGYRPILRALDNGHQLLELYICPAYYLGDNNQALVARARVQGARIIELSDAVFSKVAYRERPEGLLAVAPQVRLTLADLAKRQVDFLVIAEAIEKPGNLGTILRSADAAGVDALVVCDRKTDICNPNVVCASIGTLFTVPTLEAPGDETLAWVKQRGLKVIAATPHAEALFTEVDLRQPVAIAVGTEQYGLSERWMAAADVRVRIPMFGQADSLNVATATTLMLYEVVRQRGRRPPPPPPE